MALLLAHRPNLEAVRALMNRGVVMRDLRVTDGGTLLHAAARESHGPALLDMLVGACGVEVEARDSVGGTCMHYASNFSNADAMLWLNQRRRRCDAAARRAQPPLRCAADGRWSMCTHAILLGRWRVARLSKWRITIRLLSWRFCKRCSPRRWRPL